MNESIKMIMVLQRIKTTFQLMFLIAINAYEMCMKAPIVTSFKLEYKKIFVQRFSFLKSFLQIAIVADITRAFFHNLIKVDQLIDHSGILVQISMPQKTFCWKSFCTYSLQSTNTSSNSNLYLPFTLLQNRNPNMSLYSMCPKS